MLTGKTALITGSTSGIGKGITEGLAKAGANIILNGIEPPEAIAPIVETLSQKHGVKVTYSHANMAKPEQIEAMVSGAKDEFGAVDILVNNAGIQHVEKVESFPAAKWDAIIAINLSSAFHTIRHCVPLMKEKGWGRIINVASVHGLVASPYKSAYVTAKHGMLGLTKTIALELALDNITVNAICPGYVKTPLVEGQIADTAKARGISEEAVVKDVLLAAQPTKKFTTIQDVADLALFLCSDAAQNITGSAQSIDGGWAAQ